MPVLRAMAIIPHVSGLPEDASVNTFHFLSTAPDIEDDFVLAATAVQNFYFATPTGEGGPLRAYWGPTVAEDLVRCKVYDLSQPEPRVPGYDEIIGLEGAVAGSGIPQEVAVTLSFQAAAESGEPQARRRGRIFFGPLGQNALSGTEPNDRPAAALISRLRAAAQDMLTTFAATTCPWVVYSEADNVGRLVDNGWIDDAFDTQRRRGVAPTERVTFAL